MNWPACATMTPANAAAPPAAKDHLDWNAGIGIPHPAPIKVVANNGNLLPEQLRFSAIPITWVRARAIRNRLQTSGECSFLYNLPLERTSSSPMIAPRWVDEIVEDGRYQVWSPGRTGSCDERRRRTGKHHQPCGGRRGAVQREHRRHPSRYPYGQGQQQSDQFFSNQQPRWERFFIRFPARKTAPRRPLRAAFFDVDMGVAKTFPLVANAYHLQFRADAFNVFNHPNFVPGHEHCQQHFWSDHNPSRQELSRVMQFPCV